MSRKSVLRFTIRQNSGGQHRVEFAGRLLDTTGLFGAWAPLATQRLNSSSTVVTLMPRGQTNVFLRAVLCHERGRGGHIYLHI